VSLVQITPPAVLPISLAEAKAIARLDGTDEVDDAMVVGFIRAATEWVEQRLGRALITSTWRFYVSHFPCAWGQIIRIPLAPVQSVDEIRYIDVAGVEQVLAPVSYLVHGIGDVARIALAPNKTWPPTRWQDEAIAITFTAGFGPDWNSVPEPVRTAIAEVVRGLYDGCAPSMADELLEPYKVWAV
jgi:uncharacterized phiE125 gp8 family phage protein